MSDPTADPTRNATRLPRWLLGDYPPADIVADLARYDGLSEKVRDNFWEALQPNLAERIDDRVGAAMAKFCRGRDLDPQQLLEPVRVGRWVLYQAARYDLEPAIVAETLEPLSEAASAVLTPCYTQARQLLRMRIITNSLSQHGKLVRSIGWRVDTVRRTHDGGGIDLPIALMTFRYSEGDRDERITLQMLPEAIEELRIAIKEIAG